MSLDSLQPVEQVVGFDARDYRDDFSRHWPAHRIEQFLFRADVKKVLSTDVRVWPTLLSSLGVTMPHQCGLQDLWASVNELRAGISGLGPSATKIPFRIVAISLVQDGAQESHPVAQHLEGLIDPSTQNAKWRLLGYDVADAWLLSALSNCGFVPPFDDVHELRRQWAPLLNKFHLFDNVAAASSFRKMSDIRLSGDHAPTFVYGIRVVVA